MTSPRDDRRLAAALAGALLLMVAFVYGGSPEVLDPLVRARLRDPAAREWARHTCRFALAFVLFFLVPAIWAGRRPLADFGIRTGDRLFGAAFLAVAIPLVTPLLWLGVRYGGLAQEYPLAKLAGSSAKMFLMWEATYLVYYVAWECFFRGFLLFGLRERMGAALAVVVQTIPSALLHIGKPASETFASVAAGILFGAVALRSRSVLYVLLFHWYVGAMTDLLSILSRR
ncbi:MAG: CPBP family intramembrane metalloprotease [Planctomycetes bacterium]|nr:CPBP family intramembrane metalloprotease [Planctomycetota bacterium]